MNTNRLKKYLKIYTGRATKLDLVLWLRDEWAEVVELNKNIIGAERYKNGRHFLDDRFVTLLLDKLDIPDNLRISSNFDFACTSKFFVNNPVVFKCLLENNLICLDELEPTVKTQQILVNRLSTITTNRPNIYKVENIEAFIGSDYANFRYIRLPINKQRYAFYDLNKYSLGNKNSIMYERMQIDEILEKYIGRHILYIESEAEIIEECSKSKIFEFIKPINPVDQKLLANYILCIPNIFESYYAESTKNQQLLDFFCEYALTQLFNATNTKAAMIAQDLGTDINTLIDILMTGQQIIVDNVELPEISF